MDISDERFNNLIVKAMNQLPQQYIRNLNNVVITYADDPTTEQLVKQGIRENQLLLGLYEGVPLPQRGAGYNLVLPDKITLFKNSLIQLSSDETDLFRRIKHTLWHEIAHHYGLGHDQIDELEGRQD